MALRRSTRMPLMTGENIELADMALPFLQNQAVDILQPDIINSGGITGVKDDCGRWRRCTGSPIALHNVSGLWLAMASQQLAAAVFNCPRIECLRNANELPGAKANPLVIKNGRMKVSTAPGLGIDVDEEYLKANRADGEPWWG